MNWNSLFILNIHLFLVESIDNDPKMLKVLIMTLKLKQILISQMCFVCTEQLIKATENIIYVFEQQVLHCGAKTPECCLSDIAIQFWRQWEIDPRLVECQCGRGCEETASESLETCEKQHYDDLASQHMFTQLARGKVMTIRTSVHVIFLTFKCLR